MRRTTALTMAVLIVVSVAAVPISGLAATGDGVLADSHDSNATATNSTDGNASVAPGERLSGVVGVQQAELEGEVDRRAFGLQVARAASNESKAGVVATQVEDVQQRIADLRGRQQELNESVRNGSISEGKYRAQVAQLGAQMKTAKQLANQTANESGGLPVDLLESKGINATAIQQLRERASELGGKQVAEIARSIAGPSAAPRGPPADAGPAQGMPGNVTDGDMPDMPGSNVSDDNVTDGNQSDRQMGSADGQMGSDSTDADKATQGTRGGSPGGR